MESNWQKKAIENQKQYKNLLQRADKNRLLKQLPGLHEEAFAKVDCLDCAACCKNYFPTFKRLFIKHTT